MAAAIGWRSSDGGPGREVDLRAYLYLALMVLIGSSTAPAAKFAVRELPAGLLPLVRFGVAGLCLLPVVWRGGATSSGWSARTAGGWSLAAGLCVPVNQTFFLNGAKLTPTSHVALIYAACPLVVLLLATALGQERLVPARLVGVLVERARGGRDRRSIASGGAGRRGRRRSGATCSSSAR